MTDTIVALSTPPGSGAIAIVRASGPKVRDIARKVFRGPALASRRAVVGALLNREGEAVDQVVALLFRAPRSYTREDVLELHCHGGAAIVREALSACIAAGARPAQPGEFTKRAYLNGGLDLSQAQAVADLIAASSAGAARASYARLRGGLSHAAKALEDNLLDAAAELTAYLDYPDEDLEPVTAAEVSAAIRPVLNSLREAIAKAPQGHRALEGVRVTIAGAPNAGKSSLLNALLQSERAIVTSLPGTTRDLITESVSIGGYAFHLTDSAGLRDRAEEIEAVGIARARESIQGCDILLLCVDASVPLPQEAEALLNDPRALLALNKSDLPCTLSAQDFSCPSVVLSATLGHGLEELREALLGKADLLPPGEALLTHERDLDCALRAAEALERSLEALGGLSLDCAALDMQEALEALRGLTDTSDGAVLERMFSSFCLGK